MSKILARVIGGGGSAGTATSNDVLSGKTFSNDDDVDIVGTAIEYPTTEHHVTTADQIIIPANSHTTGNQVLKGIKDVKIPPSTIRSGKTVTINNGEKDIVSINGTYTSSISNGQQPITANKIVSGYSGFVNGSNEIQGSIPDKSGMVSSASAIDMNGSDIRMKIPSDGFYSSASYIKSQSVNFGDALASEVAAGKTFTSSSGLKIQGSAPLQNGSVLYAKPYDQIAVPAGRFTTGDVISRGLNIYGLVPENVRAGATVNIWNGSENIASIVGTSNDYKMAAGTVYGSSFNYDTQRWANNYSQYTFKRYNQNAQNGTGREGQINNVNDNSAGFLTVPLAIGFYPEIVMFRLYNNYAYERDPNNSRRITNVYYTQPWDILLGSYEDLHIFRNNNYVAVDWGAYNMTTRFSRDPNAVDIPLANSSGATEYMILGH